MNTKHIRTKNILSLLKNKKSKIIILGFGLTGKSLLTWCLNNLSLQNEYIVIDKREQDISSYSSTGIVTFQIEAEQEFLFSTADFILPSPGIKIEKEKAGSWYTKIIPELDLFYFFLTKKKVKSILITGSIGKSSLTSILYQTIIPYQKAYLCGNIGFPVMDFLNIEITSNEIFCIEASDAQLKHCVLVAPTIFLITNLFKNHLNFHKTFLKYVEAKLTPIKFQIHKIKHIILSEQTIPIITRYNKFNNTNSKITVIKENSNNHNTFKLIKKKFVYAYKKEEAIFLDKKLILEKIPNISFINNWLMTATAIYFLSGRVLKIKNENITLPDHRLKKIFNSEKIDIFNDSKSTIIESTVAGLSQLQNSYPKNTMFFVIIGGLSKGVDRTESILNIKNQKMVKLAIFGKEINSFKEKFINEENIIFEEELKKCLEKILELTKYSEKNVILFSPGGSSFDQFSSFEERGTYFEKLVKTINK